MILRYYLIILLLIFVFKAKFYLFFFQDKYRRLTLSDEMKIIEDLIDDKSSAELSLLSLSSIFLTINKLSQTT